METGDAGRPKRELTEHQTEDILRISAMCKQIAVKGGPMTLDVTLDRELRSRIQVFVDEAKHMRNYLRSYGYVGDDD